MVGPPTKNSWMPSPQFRHLHPAAVSSFYNALDQVAELNEQIAYENYLQSQLDTGDDDHQHYEAKISYLATQKNDLMEFIRFAMDFESF